MNKADMNRTIQILEEQVKELKNVNRKLLGTQCVECSKCNKIYKREATNE